MRIQTIHRNQMGDVLNECSAQGFQITTADGGRITIMVDGDGLPHAEPPSALTAAQQWQAAADDMGGFSSDTAALAFLRIIGNGNPNVKRAVERLRQSLIAQQPAADQFIATFRCENNGIVGTTDAKVHSVTRHDDGRIEVVIDHWPRQPAADCTCPHQDAREPDHDVACPARLAQQPAVVEGFDEWYDSVDARFWDNRDACNAAFHAGKHAALAQQPAPSALVGVEGTWLWGKLMDWCREQRIAPATQDKLFAIAGEAHRLNALAQQPAQQGGGEVTPPSALVGAEDIEVLKRLRDALHDAPMNGWWLGVEVLDRVIAAITQQQEPKS